MTRSNKHTMELFDFAFYEWEKSSPHQALLRQPFGDKWEEYSWAQVGVMARKMANGLRSLNMPAKAHVGIYSKNCREWVIADIAILMAGYVSVPFFATLSGEQLQEVLELGDVKALFVGKVEDWDNKKEKVSSTIPKIAFPHYKDHSLVADAHQWEDIMAKFEPIEGVHTPMMDDVWTIIFTSGTTGTPKGVVLTYRALEETKWSVEELNPVQVSFEGDNRFFSYLPLNHIAERVVVEYTAFKYGGTISFTESLATFSDNLIATKPTIFFAVPRILSKFQSAIRAKLPQEQLDAMLANPEQATTLKKQLQASLGLDEARAIISGAAPLSEALKDWCASIGLPITNGYGMTENCAIATILLPNEKKPGSVGRPQPRVEIRIDEQSSEILMKGPFLMSGYYKSPEKTKETLVDGWLRTGDMGYLDDDGFLYITGRVKDTFKSSKGEFIVPAHLEKGFSGHQDIEQVCILGLGCPQPVALLVLSEMGRAKKTKAEIEETLRHLLDDINQDLPSYQKISTIVINQESWTVENHLLTPTLKVKRNMLHQRYANDLMLWHERPEQIIWEQEVH